MIINDRAAASNRRSAIAALVVILLFSSLTVCAVAQSTAKGPVPSVAGEFAPFVTPVAGQPKTKNFFAADFTSTTNRTFFAGQEARMRISTTLFNTEQFRHASQPLRGRDSAHNVLVPLYRRWLFNKTKGYPVEFRTNITFFPGFNITGPGPVRVRVIPAFSPRTATGGAVVSCSAQTDVWNEFWAMSGRTFAWGKSIAYSGYVTFIVPPFPFKVCVKDVSLIDGTPSGYNADIGVNNGWTEFYNSPGVHHPAPPAYFFSASSFMQEEDYAAIKVIANGRRMFRKWNGVDYDMHDFFASGNSIYRGDIMKLVPAGFPCTYEKSSATPDIVQNVHPILGNTVKQYCGSNYVKAFSGDFVGDYCVKEGSVTSGIGITGSERKNPWTNLDVVMTGEPLPSGIHLVGYFKLPAAGQYDICLSPKSYRLTTLNVSLTPSHDLLLNAAPVWFKLFDSSTTGCPQSTTEVTVDCSPRKMLITVNPLATDDTRWSSTETTLNSWGSIKISGSGLSSMPAVNWEYSNPRSYFQTTGGDQFRLVPASAFGTEATGSAGTLYKRADGQRWKMNVQLSETTPTLTTVNRISAVTSSDLRSAGSFTQYVMTQPGSGTAQSNVGCFYAQDNFGTQTFDQQNGNPSTCCAEVDGRCTSSLCNMTDVDSQGVTASGNLGGDPRAPYYPWNINLDGQSAVWAYIRYLPGTWRVCYRKVGTNNWRSLPMSGTTSTFSFTPVADATKGQFHFYINDTRANTLGEFRVHSNVVDLTYEYLNIHSPVPDGNVVGSSLKIVKYTESCYTSSGEPYATSIKPGLPECSFAHCNGEDTCAGCEGAAYISSTGTRDVYFYLRLPQPFLSTNEYYRVCFRHGLSNWYQLSNPLFVAHQTLNAPSKFNTEQSPDITYDIYDTREGTWGWFIFKKVSRHSPRLSAASPPFGDVVRLVPNETAFGTPTNCHAVWNVVNTSLLYTQQFKAVASAPNLGLFCAAKTSPGCETSNLQPSARGMNAVTPYVDFNSYSNLSLVNDGDGTVAMIKIPPKYLKSRAQAYRVCYKQKGLNWQELRRASDPSWFLHPKSPTHYTISVAHYDKIYAGMYGYITLFGDASNKIVPSLDYFKLVPPEHNCERPPVANLGPLTDYATLVGSGISWYGARIVDGRSDAIASQFAQPAEMDIARVYFTFPLPNSTGIRSDNYRVCYMRRHLPTDRYNWLDLGTITVYSEGMSVDVLNHPVRGAPVSFKFYANDPSIRLNTTGNGDQFKVVGETSPCADGIVPFGVTSLHTGLEMKTKTDAEKWQGIVDLGDGDDPLASVASATVTMSHTEQRMHICYKRRGKPWMEVVPVSKALQTHPDDGGMYNVHSSAISGFTLPPSLLALYPGDSNQQFYSGSQKYTSSVIAGSQTTAVSRIFITGSQIAFSSSDSVKLVLQAEEINKGVYDVKRNIDCNSPSSVDGTVTVVTIFEVNVTIRIPPKPGKYLLCYKRYNNNTWIQVQSAQSAYINPFTVIPNYVQFSVSIATDSTTITLYDFWNYNGEGQGALNSNDKVYLANVAATCGASNSFQNVAPALSPVINVSDIAGTTTAVRRTSPITTISVNTFTGFSGWLKVCYYRSQYALTTATNVQSFMPVGWYEATNYDNPTLGSFLPFTTASKIVLDSCPGGTYRAGNSFDVSVSIRNSEDVVVPFGTGRYSYELEVVPINGFNVTNVGGTCLLSTVTDHGWPATNLKQHSVSGYMTFTLIPMSLCPVGGCVFQISSLNLLSSANCTFDVVPNEIATIAPFSMSTVCEVNGTICSMKIVVYATDGPLAHAANVTVLVSVYNATGIQVLGHNEVGPPVPLSTNTSVGSLFEGYFTLFLYFDIEDPTNFTQDRNITVEFDVNGTKLNSTLTVIRPFISAVHIVDLYPSDPAEARVLDGSISEIRSALVPMWQPSGMPFFGGAHGAVNGGSAINAAPGSHIVAQQFYTVVLRPVLKSTSWTKYTTRMELLPPEWKTITMHLSNGTTGNEILVFSADCLTDESCNSPFTSINFTDSFQKITFRFKNSIGCSKTTPCTITFKFGGSEIGTTTSLTTPVRSVASQLSVKCYANTGLPVFPVDVTTLTGASTCDPASLEKGWIVVATALDDNNVVDDFFDGKIIAALRGDTTAKLTTIDNLKKEVQPDFISFNATAGKATLAYLTLHRPCQSCYLQIFSDWGTGIAEAGQLVGSVETARMKCTLTTPLVSCAIGADGTCAGIESNFTYSTTDPNSNIKAAIYTDTVLCVDVEAVNVNGERSLYDTVWVHYVISGDARLSIRSADPTETTFAKRYRPMKAGKVQFCFSVVGDVSPSALFALRFIAQKFNTPGHWTSGSTGECTLGTFAVFAHKQIATLKIATTYGENSKAVSSFPSSDASIVFSRNLPDDPILTVDLLTYDHYGNPIASTSLLPAYADLEAMIDYCEMGNLDTKCIAGSINTVNGSQQPGVKLTAGDPRLLGAITVQMLEKPTTKVTAGTMRYLMKVLKYCIGCRLTFKLKSTGNVQFQARDRVTMSLVDVIAELEVNVLLLPNQNTKRMVVFFPERSPVRTWWRWDQSYPFLTGTIFFNDNCITNSSAGCQPLEKQFLLSDCDSRGTSYLYRDGTNPIDLLVVVAEPSASLDMFMEASCQYNLCPYAQYVRMQIDIMSTFQVGLSAGTQYLKCKDGGCIDDGTPTPKKTLQAFGSTAVDAIRRFKESSYVARIASFVVSGLRPSEFYSAAADGTYTQGAFPTRAGHLVGSATSTGTAITMQSLNSAPYSLIWRGSTIARQLAFSEVSRDEVCPRQAIAPCFTGSSGECPFTGYAKNVTYDDLAFNYTSGEIVPGVAFPLTLEVLSLEGARVFGAQGRVSLTLFEWHGCNNGGTMTVSGNRDLVNGRVTLYVKFSAPCEKCRMRAKLTPSASQGTLYDKMNRNPASFIAESKFFSVSNKKAIAERVVVKSVASSIPSELTVATVVTLSLDVVARVQKLMVVVPTESATVAAYIAPATTDFNQWWYGNGGLLRASKASGLYDRHANKKTITGTGVLEFLFTRTCTLGCKVNVFYQLTTSGTYGSIELKNNRADSLFFVTTTPTRYATIGFRPRTALKNKHFAVALWQMGSELQDEVVNPIPYAGVASSSFRSGATVVSDTVDQSNGDGGTFTYSSYMTNRAEVHRLLFTRTCQKCRLYFGGDDPLDVIVTATATQLRIVAPPGYTWQGSYPSITSFNFSIFAVDDEGYTDLWYGGNPTCTLHRPFKCAAVAANVTAVPFSKLPDLGVLMKSYDLLAGELQGQISSGHGYILGKFHSPMRFVYPQFTATGAFVVQGKPTDPVNVLSPTNNPASLLVTSTGAVSSFLPIKLSFAFVRSVDGFVGAFIQPDANLPVTVSFGEACPPRTELSVPTVLEGGYGNMSVAFSNPTTGADVDCVVTVAVDSLGAVCSSCAVAHTIKVSSVVATHWTWLKPTPWDNGDPAAIGPYYGAVGRPSTLEVQLFGLAQGGSIMHVKTCDVPSTAAIESCSFEVTVTGACPIPPTISPVSTFDSLGRANASIVWADGGDAAYSCQISAVVKRVGGDALTPYVRPTAAVLVQKPYRIAVLSNFSYKGVFMTGFEYPMMVGVLDKYGALCRGDSQTAGTLASLSVVIAGSHTTTNLVRVVNANTTVHSSPYPYTPTGGNLAARMVSGFFKFQLVFTDSSLKLSLGGIKVKVTSEIGTVFSPVVDTMMHATKLRFSPLSPMPRYAVNGRALFSYNSSHFIVQAVDNVKEEWVALGLVTHAPNIATASEDFGNDLPVSWSVLPPPSQFPLTFETGARDFTLSAGEAKFGGIKWTRPDETVQIAVTTVFGQVSDTEDFTVTFQTPTQIVYESSAGRCAGASCVLPTLNTPYPFTKVGEIYKINNLQPFHLTFSVLGAAGQIIQGDEESVFELTMEGTSNQLFLATDDASYLSNTMYGRTVHGQYTFKLSFVGGTEGGTSVRFKISCPQLRPNSVTAPGDTSYDNPCYAFGTTIYTAYMQVTMVKAPQTVFTSATVLASIPIIKVRATTPDLATYPIEAFARAIATEVKKKGFPFLDELNADGVVSVLACLVDRLYFNNSDLGASVCNIQPGDAAPDCSASRNDTCPPAIEWCRCPGYLDDLPQRRQLFSRYLLAMDTDDIQLEIKYDLSLSSRYNGLTEEQVAKTYTELGVATIEVLSTIAYFSLIPYYIDVGSLSVRKADETLVVPVIPTTTAPPPTDPPVNETLPPSAAVQVTVTFNVVCFALFALLLLF